MNRAGFVRSLVRQGCCLQRQGKRHDIYANPRTGRQAPVPRHTTIKDSLAALIERQLGLETRHE
ncbi:MAG TPA: type II toxin-antitoxin system HicA family toxin [Candidatus Hydrogenedentes bacterium]|nr:type II toxin-antitoxin system HicA family toxin [Candidatus Hydrogenedentota bacterium]